VPPLHQYNTSKKKVTFSKPLNFQKKKNKQKKILSKKKNSDSIQWLKNYHTGIIHE
jgi:hypothetical protein